MLIDFSVENYRSIADKQTLSLVASKHRSDAKGQAAVECSGFKHQLLTSAVIYGANGSGKSNILRALNDFQQLVTHSSGNRRHNVQPYLLDPALAETPTRFEVSFLLEGVRFQYGFSVDSDRVYEEWLLAYPRRTTQVWFDRRWNGTNHEIQFGSHLKGEKTRVHAITRAD
ncbi:MAG: AAA family ATPase, partial [Byssovorax sp.]